MKAIAPLYIVHELSAKCFAGCPGCFRTFVKGPLDGEMSRETFEASLVGIPRGTMILPQFHGESLLHPDFPFFLERYKALGLRVSMPASGSAGWKHIPLLVGEASPVYILILSIDGFCEYSQSIRRGNISLERAERFAQEAIQTRGPGRMPWIAVRWVENGQSEREFELYLKKWLFDEGADFILRSRLFNYGSPTNSPSALGSSPCHSLLEGNPVVLWNGNVLLCERVPDREGYVLGNVRTHSWEEMFAKREKVAAMSPSPCEFCSAAYLLTGLAGEMRLRHPESEREDVPIYVHSDHSQTFYSLVKAWSGINWSLGARP